MELESKPTLNMLPVVLYVTSTVSMIVLNDISSLDVPHPLCLYIHTIQVFIKVTTQLSQLEYITKQNKLCCGLYKNLYFMDTSSAWTLQ